MTFESPTTINLTSGMDNLFFYLNSITNNLFSNLLLVAIYVIFSAGFYFSRRDLFGSLAVGGFAIFIVGLLFWLGGLISGVTFAFVVAVSIISFASLWIKTD